MFDNKVLDFLLDLIPRSQWNRLSRVIAFFSPRTIGSPISFSTRGFTLKEYDLRTASPDIVEQYFTFCYPSDEIAEPRKEFEIDKQYWPSSSTFIVTRDSDKKIVGSLQFIIKTDKTRLPVEYSHVVSDTNGTIENSELIDLIPHGKIAEFYRCRRHSQLSGLEATIVIPMLFKAGFAKTLQNSVEFSLLSYDKRNSGLKNLYIRKLAFRPTRVSITYEYSQKEWDILYSKTLSWENEVAGLSKAHFKLVTYSRSNLKFGKFKQPEQSTKLITESDTILFADVVTVKNQNSIDVIEHAYNNI